MTNNFEMYIISAYNIMIKKGYLMESGIIVLNDDSHVSFKIQKLASKKKSKNQKESQS